MSKKIIGNLEKGLLFIISAPAGTGKSTLVAKLVKEFPDAIEESRSCTTRKPRGREEEYEFLSIDDFEKRVAKGEFLEYAKVFGNYYGTLKSEVHRIQESGKHAVLVIDTQGAMILKGQVEATFIFLSPPSIEELKKRLFKRGTESETNIEERLHWVERELSMGKNYDYQLINDDLEVSYKVLKSIIIAQEYKKRI
jgi:guanylate kinase